MEPCKRGNSLNRKNLTLLRKSLFWAFIQISSYSPLLKKCAVVIPSLYPDYCRPPPFLQRATLSPISWKDWGFEKKMNPWWDLKGSCHRYLSKKTSWTCPFSIIVVILKTVSYKNIESFLERILKISCKLKKKS